MPTKTIEVHEVPSHLAELLALIAAGTEVILVQDNTPLARLVPINVSSKQRIAGLHIGSTWVSEDFDAPLPDDFWLGTS